jgi:ribonuclease HII
MAQRTPKGSKPDGRKASAPAEKLCFSHERRLLAQGCRFIAGVDEAGRGPLAGPVVAAAVILDPQRIPQGLDDSKVLKAEARESLYEAIMATAFVAAVSASAQRIDAINIRQATLWAMCASVQALPVRPNRVLVDGREFPDGLPCPADAVIDGDALILSIAAASIIAKVTRDRMMKRVAGLFGQYGFERHMGYATPEHRAALHRLGPCALHRRSFAPVRESLQTRSAFEAAAE